MKRFIDGMIRGFNIKPIIPIKSPLDLDNLQSIGLNNSNYTAGTADAHGNLTIPDGAYFINIGKNRYILINANGMNVTLSPPSSSLPKPLIFEGFNNNNYGSAIYCDNLTTNSILILMNCYTSIWGGAIYCKGTFTMNQGSVMKLNNNSGNGNGGAIYCITFTMNQESVMKLNNNSGSSWGGAIYCDGTFTMKGGSIKAINNSSGTYGGAIWCKSFTMSQGSIEANNNSSNYRGAICCDNTFNMTQGTIKAINNNSNNDGGAIWCRNSITLTTEGDISPVIDPSKYKGLENIAPVYFYGNRDRGNRPNDIYMKSNNSNSTLTINGNGVCAMYGGVRSYYNVVITVIKNDKGLYILGNIGDMKNERGNIYLPINLKDGVLCLLATLQDLNSYKGTVTIGTTGNPKLVIWLAKTDPDVPYEYGLTYWETTGEAQGVIDNFENPKAGSLLEWMKNNAHSYLLQTMS